MSLEARVHVLEQRATQIGAKLDENTALTKEVLDTLRAFRMIGTLAKWATAVGVALAGAYHGAQAFWKWLHG